MISHEVSWWVEKSLAGWAFLIKDNNDNYLQVYKVMSLSGNMGHVITTREPGQVTTKVLVAIMPVVGRRLYSLVRYLVSLLCQWYLTKLVGDIFRWYKWYKRYIQVIHFTQEIRLIQVMQERLARLWPDFRVICWDTFPSKRPRPFSERSASASEYNLVGKRWPGH